MSFPAPHLTIPSQVVRPVDRVYWVLLAAIAVTAVIVDAYLIFEGLSG